MYSASHMIELNCCRVNKFSYFTSSNCVAPVLLQLMYSASHMIELNCCRVNKFSYFTSSHCVTPVLSTVDVQCIGHDRSKRDSLPSRMQVADHAACPADR